MNGRHYLEEALSNAIIAQDTRTFQTLLPLLYENHANSSLATRDKNDQGLLNSAFTYGTQDVAAELLLLLRNNTDLVFAADSKEKTLMWHAANRGFDQLVALLIDLADKQPKESSAARFWLRGDHRGDTPLHRAAMNVRNHSALELLTRRISQEKNAFELINQPNRDGKTALHYAFELGCFTSMSLLVQTGADIFAKDNQGEMPFSHVERFTDIEQLDMFGWLADRLHIIAEEANGKTVHNYQLIEHDRTTLTKVLTRINTQLDELARMKKIPDQNKKLAIAFPTLIFCVFAASCYWMLTQSDSNIILIMMTLLCKYIIAVCAAICAARYFWNKEITISGKELRGLQNMIQFDVIEKLRLLQPNDRKENPETAPSPFTEYDIQCLKEDTWRLTQTESVSAVIAKLNSLKRTLNKLAGDMNISQQPLLLFNNNATTKMEPVTRAETNELTTTPALAMS